MHNNSKHMDIVSKDVLCSAVTAMSSVVKLLMS